jgi:hypothetical protein
MEFRPPESDGAGVPDWARNFATFADAQRFEANLRTEMDRRSLAFTGELPKLADTDGRELFVGNLAQSCASAPKTEWRRITREFLDLFQSVDSFVAISPDVAKLSLRLRLYDLADHQLGTSLDSTTALQVLKTAVHWAALPGLHWVLFVRRGGAGQNVFPEHLSSWGISVDEAWLMAKQQTLRHDTGELTEYHDMATYSGDSMFTTTGVLESHRWLTSAEHGLFVSTPTRHHVLVHRVDVEGVTLLPNLFQMTLDVYETGPYPLSTNVWWVPATGPGERGENAELIELVPHGINEDGDATFGLSPGPQLKAVLEALARDTGLQ